MSQTVDRLREIDSNIFRITKTSFTLEQLRELDNWITKLESASYDKGVAENKKGKQKLLEEEIENRLFMANKSGYEQGYKEGLSEGKLDG